MTAAKVMIFSPKHKCQSAADVLTPALRSGFDYVPTLHPPICMQYCKELLVLPQTLDYSSKTQQSHHLEKWPNCKNAFKLTFKPVFHG